MKKLFDINIIQENDIAVDGTCIGNALVSPTTGGTFSGEISGEVVPVGMGITYTPYEGKNDIISTLLLHTDDGADIIMDMKIYLDIDTVYEEKLMRGESVSPDSYYFKGIVDFKTGDERYKYLERKVCVCESQIDDWESVTASVYLL